MRCPVWACAGDTGKGMVGGFVLGTVISTLQKSYFIVFKKAAVFVIRISKRGLSNSRACSLQHGTSINFSIHQMLLLICWHTAQTSMCYFAGFLIDLCVDTGDVPGNKASLTAPAIRWLILCQAKMSEKKCQHISKLSLDKYFWL